MTLQRENQAMNVYLSLVYNQLFIYKCIKRGNKIKAQVLGKIYYFDLYCHFKILPGAQNKGLITYKKRLRANRKQVIKNTIEIAQDTPCKYLYMSIRFVFTNIIYSCFRPPLYLSFNPIPARICSLYFSILPNLDFDCFG